MSTPPALPDGFSSAAPSTHERNIFQLRPNHHVAAVATALAERADDLLFDLAEAVTHEALLCDASTFLPRDSRGKVRAANNIRSVLSAMACEGEFDPTAAREAGIQRARERTALSSVDEFYRLGFRRLGDAISEEVASNPPIDAGAVHMLRADLHAVEQQFMAALVAGYHDEQNRQYPDDASQTLPLIDALLQGGIGDKWHVWETANRLRLPSRGPFVVIAAEVTSVGSEALPGIAAKLPSLDVCSAWRLFPDLQVGITHVKSDEHLQRTLALVSRIARGRVGVSAPFDELGDTPQALHFAKVTLRGGVEKPSGVTVFDGSILAIAAVSAPGVMVKSVAAELDCFSELPREERETLFETFRVWQESDASVRDTAAQLACHPNTVRHRLRRIEQRTGRSLSRPRDVAELCLAFEVHKRLM